MTGIFVLMLFLSAWSNTYACSQTNLQLENKKVYEFTSPNFPKPYPEWSYSCNFEGTAPAGQNVYAYCDHVDIEGPSCYLASLSFSATGDNSYNDGEYWCGRHNFLRRQTNGNKIAMKFEHRWSFYYWWTTQRNTGFRCYIATWPTVTPSCNCGKKKSTSRVVGGVSTEVNEYPWMAALRFKGNTSPFCGGSLIAERWILTAAHCAEPFSVANLEVVLGAHQLGVNTQSGTVYGVAQKIVHANYNETSVDNDIALLYLDRPVTYTSEVSPVCLPFGLKSNLDGQVGTVTGWGTIKYQGASSTQLLEVDLDILSTQSCRQYYTTPGQLTDNMFCSLTSNKDACQGDSGGPFVYSPSTNYYQVGVVSWGVECATATNPGVYAKVSNYLNWIETKTGATFCKPQN